MEVRGNKARYSGNSRDQVKNQRKPKRLIVLSTEGTNKTETNYFNELKKESDYIVEFAPGNYTDPEQMLAVLIDKCEDLGFDYDEGDRAFCLIDGDVSIEKERQIKKADNKAKDNKIINIVSNPCFEVWFLCHYEYSTKQYVSSDEVIKDLKRKCKGYSFGNSVLDFLRHQRNVNSVNFIKRLQNH